MFCKVIKTAQKSLFFLILSSMKRKNTYLLLSSLLLIILTVTGYITFVNKSYKQEPDVYEDDTYTYIPKYIQLSEYDDDFREASEALGYDWTLVAAIAYTESRFDSTAISEAGACGVMQVMPNTMRGFDIPDSMHMDSKTNIMAATELLKALDKRFRYIRNKEERINFVLASYNAGYGHIQDAMQLAKKHGKNRFIWNNSVDSFLILKSKPEFYNDSVCRNGKFAGWKETLSFVKKVHSNWNRFSTLQESYTDSINTIVANDSTIRIR